MNFLAHLVLAGDDEGLRLGAMLGDFVRGRRAVNRFPPAVARGIRLHRHIDSAVDELAEVRELRKAFPKPFRRYGGIITDLAYDHELACHWQQYGVVSLEEFDAGVRLMLDRNAEWVPGRLQRFMAYADRRGLFASYRHESEILLSLAGIGGRLKRPNPLHRCEEIWPQMKPRFEETFERVFAGISRDVADWRRLNPPPEPDVFTES